MKYSKLLLMVLGLTMVFALCAFAQTADVGFVFVSMDATNYDVKLQIRGSAAFKLGSSNLLFTYNSSDLNTPTVLTAHNFSGGSYDVIGLTKTGSTVSVNIVLNSVGSGTTVQTSFTDVVTLRFPIINKGGSSNLVWKRQSDTPPTVIYLDDETTGPLTVLNKIDWNTSPLPVQLSSFTAALLTSSNVTLNWTTQSETNNYGFWVQKSSTPTGTFVNINASIRVLVSSNIIPIF